MLRKRSTDQSFIRKRNTTYKIGTLTHTLKNFPQSKQDNYSNKILKDIGINQLLSDFVYQEN